jgi:hypothetical protein
LYFGPKNIAFNDSIEGLHGLILSILHLNMYLASSGMNGVNGVTKLIRLCNGYVNMDCRTDFETINLI